MEWAVIERLRDRVREVRNSTMATEPRNWKAKLLVKRAAKQLTHAIGNLTDAMIFEAREPADADAPCSRKV